MRYIARLYIDYLKESEMLGRLFLLASLLVSSSLVSAADECVVLLHGLGRTHHSMDKIEAILLERGYLVWSKSYNSREAPVDWLAVQTLNLGLAYCEQQRAMRVHLVSHSLGGLLIRVYLQDHSIANLGRIVMLAPPNHGSEVADVLKENSLYEWAMGPAGQVLGTGPDGIASQLGPIAGEIGIIAGNTTSDPWFSPIIPGADDGKVSVESTRLNEMKDFLVVEAGHTFIMRNDLVIAQLLIFLSEGEFKPLPPSPDSSGFENR